MVNPGLKLGNPKSGLIKQMATMRATVPHRAAPPLGGGDDDSNMLVSQTCIWCNVNRDSHMKGGKTKKGGKSYETYTYHI